MPSFDGLMAWIQSYASLPHEQWRETFPDYAPMGYMNGYVPLELMHAAGYTQVLLRPWLARGARAQAHLPGFTCWTTRGVLEHALSGHLDGWSGVVFGQTCDALQGLADLWSHAVPQVPSMFFAMPHHLAAPATRPYLVAELGKMRSQLEELSERRISDAAISSSIALSNEIRTLMSLLYSAAECLHPAALHDVRRCSTQIPWERSRTLLRDLFAVLPEDGDEHSARFVIVGPELADLNLYVAIGDAGAVVVDDLLDLGQRRHLHLVSEKGDPLQALADQMLALLPTPTKYHPERCRAVSLLDTVKASRADGVIFARQKFCEPHGFDYPVLKDALDEASIPHLLVELEQTPNLGQLRTRVEALVEMVRA